MIYVCSLAELPALTAGLRPTHIVSMLGDELFPATPEWLATDRHLKLRFHDIAEPIPGFLAPQVEHLEALITFGTTWNKAGPLIIHCYAGVSRSTAAALTILCLYNQGREEKAAQVLRERAPHAQPNQLMIAIADRLLRCDGRLVDAVNTIGLAECFGLGGLVELPAELEKSGGQVNYGYES